MKAVAINLTVNGASISADVEPRLTLGGFLRRNLALTGTHLGCEHGVCGACTVIVDGMPARSCLMFAAQADGMQIVTIEGLSSDDSLSPLQHAMRKHHGLQCGFCTPGIITTMHAFLTEEPNPTAEQVREALSGNICRCTGYLPIIEAVLEAASAYQRDGTS
jgi:aerobic-type carbon monoxide dehydrogenase small subunit (CoxS/CutS family)